MVNPATGEVLAQIPLSSGAEVEADTQAAASAQKEWRLVPAIERVDYLFRLRDLL